MILVIDNVDSFVFNLARCIAAIGGDPLVVRNDAIDAAAVEALAPEALVLSPGPHGPAEAGACLSLLRAFEGRLPILGVCLGHQCIAAAFGGRVMRAREPMHGRASPIRHDGTGVFVGLPDPFAAGRYHALITEVADDGPLRVTARSEAGEIMGLCHRTAPIHGVQFHPESVLTPGGDALLANFLRLARERTRR